MQGRRGYSVIQRQKHETIGLASYGAGIVAAHYDISFFFFRKDIVFLCKRHSSSSHGEVADDVMWDLLQYLLLIRSFVTVSCY